MPLTTPFTILHWRALDRSVTAKDTAIAFQRFELGFAVFAFVEVYTGIAGHGFGFCMSAVGAGDRRFQFRGFGAIRFTGSTMAMKFVSAVIPDCCCQESEHTGIKEISPMLARSNMITVKNEQSARNGNKERVQATVSAVGEVKSAKG